MKTWAITLVVLAYCIPFGVVAQELYNDERGIFRAEVVRVIETKEEQAFGTIVKVQTLEARFLEGAHKGAVVTAASEERNDRERSELSFRPSEDARKVQCRAALLRD